MGRIRFSIITPIHISSEEEERRVRLFKLCIESVKNLNYDKSRIEHIIVNDGSVIPFDVPSYPWIRIINQEHYQKITAYQNGFNNAKGEIITMLDSDDEYDPDYLVEVDRMYKKYPSYHVFNFGCKYIHKDESISLRGPFRPKKKKVGHEVFGGGNIVNGTYVFDRTVYSDIGAFPPHCIENVDCSSINYGGVRNLYMSSPFDFSAYAQITFPEIQQFFLINKEEEPNKVIREIGNPFGQDYFLFYKITRKYHSKPVEKYLYLVHPR